MESFSTAGRSMRFAATVAAAVLVVTASIALVAAGSPGRAVKVAVAVIAAVGAGIFLRFPHRAVYVVLTLAAFDQKIPIADLETSLLDFVLIAYAPVFVGAWRGRPVGRWVAAGMAAIVVGSAAALISTTQPGMAALGAVRWALVLNFAVAVLSVVRKRGVPELRRLALLMSALGAVVTAFALLQQRGIYVFVGPPYAAERVDSTFGYYTNYAAFVACCSVVSVGLCMHLVRTGHYAAGSAVAFCGVLSLYGVAISLSRGALLVVACGLALLLVLHLRRVSWLLGGSIVVGLLGLLAYAAIPPATLAIYRQRFVDSRGSDGLRYELQDVGLSILSRHPAGIGFGNFRDWLLTGRASGAAQALAHAHSLYIQIGLDAGWLGLAGFCTVAAIAVARGGVAALRSHGAALQGVFVAALVAFLAQGTIDYFFFEAGSLVVFVGLLAGALADPGRPSPDETDADDEEAPTTMGTPIAAAQRTGV